MLKQIYSRASIVTRASAHYWKKNMNILNSVDKSDSSSVTLVIHINDESHWPIVPKGLKEKCVVCLNDILLANY